MNGAGSALEWRPAQRRDLGCPLLAVEYVHAGRVARLHLPTLCCTDMGGAIEFATSRFPGVRRIETFAGGIPDTVYLHDGFQWVALLPGAA